MLASRAELFSPKVVISGHATDITSYTTRPTAFCYILMTFYMIVFKGN